MSNFTWYIPSFNGDIRFEAEGTSRTLVKVIEPTVGEVARLKALSAVFQKHGWIRDALWRDEYDPKLQVTVVDAPINVIAEHLIADYAPGRATLTAIKFTDDHVEAYETGGSLWDRVTRWATGESRPVQAAPASEPEKAKDAYRTESTAIVKKEEPKPAKAATVKRHTICCPRCIEGPLTPAGEVLFSFLSDEEKQEYIENDHSLVVYGGITGYRYLLSHRHGKWARRFGKICRDLDNECTLHFHDHTVPPEEELLAAKLLLEHRENWLRTYGSSARSRDRHGVGVLPNPFGDYSDGTRSTSVTWQFGIAMDRVETFFAGSPNLNVSRWLG